MYITVYSEHDVRTTVMY